MKKQNRTKLFNFKVSDEEREKIRILAEHLKRTDGDAVRITIIEAVDKLQEKDSRPTG